MLTSLTVARWSPRSAKVLLLVLGLLSLSMVLLFPVGGGAPREDAAMLMRYAENVATGHGMVWNIGEPPVDGATDFLFTLLIVAVHAAGFETQAATKLVIVVAWLLTTAVVYAGARRVVGASPLVAFIAAVPIVIGPAVYYAAAGFGAPVFGFWAAVSATMTVALVQKPSRGTWFSIALGLSVLLLGLTRPEGVLLAALLALAVVVQLGLRPAVAALGPGVVLFLVLGTAYFVWRWWYFGQPLPNPYYKKGASALHISGLISSAKGSARFLFPFAALWVPALWNPQVRRLALAWATPIAGFVGMWVLLSPETNYLYRFQYPVLVLTAVFWPSLFMRLKQGDTLTPGRPSGLPWLGNRHRLLRTAIVTVAVLLPAMSFATMPRNPAYYVDHRALIGELLSPYADKGYTLATTEAGLIPFRSRWRALDTWGLNDQEIAHRGYLTAADLDRRAPVVVFVHQPYVPGQQPRPDDDLGQAWTDMTVTLNTWLTGHHYQLVRSVDDAERFHRTGRHSTWNIWVAPSLPDSRQIAQLMACHTYPGEANVAPVAAAAKACAARS
jgi:hypothetical protein